MRRFPTKDFIALLQSSTVDLATEIAVEVQKLPDSIGISRENRASLLDGMVRKYAFALERGHHVTDLPQFADAIERSGEQEFGALLINFESGYYICVLDNELRRLVAALKVVPSTQ